MSAELQISEAQAVYLEKFLNFQGSIASFAASMDIPLVDMIDILSAPPAKQRLKAAVKLTKLRRKIIITDIEITALKTLEQIAKNTHVPILERRRAASSILRAIHKPKPRRYRNPPAPRPPSPPQPPNNPPPPPEDIDDSDDLTINYFDELLTQLQETTNHTSSDNTRATDLLHSDGLCPTIPWRDSFQTGPPIASKAQRESQLLALVRASGSSHGWSPDEIWTEPVESITDQLRPGGAREAHVIAKIDIRPTHHSQSRHSQPPFKIIKPLTFKFPSPSPPPPQSLIPIPSIHFAQIDNTKSI